MAIRDVLERLSRKKFVSEAVESTALHRCLSVWQLTLMGIGGMVGSGIYFLVGKAAKEQAGIVLFCYLSTRLCSIFNGKLLTRSMKIYFDFWQRLSYLKQTKVL